MTLVCEYKPKKGLWYFLRFPRDSPPWVVAKTAFVLSGLKEPSVYSVFTSLTELKGKVQWFVGDSNVGSS